MKTGSNTVPPAKCYSIKKHLYLTQSFPYNPNNETVDNIFIKNVEGSCLQKTTIEKHQHSGKG